jgi:hypothetical protein
MKINRLIIFLIIITFGVVGYTSFNNKKISSGNLTEKELEVFFRNHTIANNHAAAIKLLFTVPQPGVAYLGTIHGYSDNMSVCEELIAPYNEDSSLSTIPGGSYYCEILLSE